MLKAAHAIPIALASAAAALPSLLAYNVSPSPTFLNQALAFALWPAFVVVSLTGGGPASQRGAWPVHAAAGLLIAATAWAWGPGALPTSLAVSAIATLAAAMVMVAGGAAAGAWRETNEQGNGQGDSPSGGTAAHGPQADRWFAAFCWAWLIAGLLNVLLSLVQVFTPDWPDGSWIAHSGYPGRAVGNLRQPNHLSSLLLWSCIATIGLLDLRRIGRHVAAVCLALLVFAVVLTASRTGLVSVVLLALWGLADRRLSKPARVLLVAAPVVYALSWLGMAEWAKLSAHSFGGSARLAETDISSSRFAIWRDTLGLIRLFPWTGVGFGEFNIAWTLTPFPHRPVAFFDHTHNLPLQLAVELGLPLAALVLGLFCWGLWRGARNAWTGAHAATPVGLAQRCAMLMVVMIGLHSLLEYPLWYSYFLLPAAWAWGYALQGAPRLSPTAAGAAKPPAASRAMVAAAVLMALCAGLSVLDYMRVVAIFSADENTPLARRIAAGQRSVLFAHHADYAAVTTGDPAAEPPQAFDRVTHYLLDTRLMMAWSRSLAAHGELDKARHIAARLREFGKADAEEFFAVCPQPNAVPVGPAPLPFQCELPVKDLGWRDFVRR